MVRIILITTAAAVSMASAAASAQSAAPAAPRLTAAQPAPAPDAARLWRGTLTYRVTVGADITGADTAVWAVRGGELRAVDHMHLLNTHNVVETRMVLPSFAPIANEETRGTPQGAIETRITYADGRARGTLNLAGTVTQLDDAAPAGTYDQAALAPVIAALPLRAGAVWTVPPYSPYVRGVTPYRVAVSDVETVSTPIGPVRAYRVTVSGGVAEMLFWFSEAEPRWEVRGEIPAMGVKIEPRSRTP